MPKILNIQERFTCIMCMDEATRHDLDNGDEVRLRKFVELEKAGWGFAEIRHKSGARWTVCLCPRCSSDCVLVSLDWFPYMHRSGYELHRFSPGEMDEANQSR